MKFRELLKVITVGNAINGIDRYPSNTTSTEQSQF